MSGLDHACQSGRHPLTERGLDLYETPACATQALVDAESLPHWLWEPEGGRGAIVGELRDRGHPAAVRRILPPPVKMLELIAVPPAKSATDPTPGKAAILASSTPAKPQPKTKQNDQSAGDPPWDDEIPFAPAI
jgi:hypothetical protein